ncbi:MAG TPA: Na+/H+ antiporter NhaA [Acidimicrobiia bacterium]|jgi:NhaA family Na+:H+ antiporter
MSTRPRPPFRALTEFLRTEAGSAAILLAAAFIALVIANSGLAGAYNQLLHTEVGAAIGPFDLKADLQHWINDGLMTIFFFVVGLEIKRELAVGALSDRRVAALPVIAALGGMLAPAAVYLALAGGQPAAGGWGIPIATDIAFAVGVLTLFGHRLHPGLRVFLLTLAIADDVGAIVVIAVAYSNDVSMAWLGVAAAGLLIMASMRRWARSPLAYVLPGTLVWLAMWESGIHPTLAGVAVAFLTPAHPIEGRPVLEELEGAIHPFSSYVVLPLFALANAGVRLVGGEFQEAVSSPAFRAVVGGLLLGKVLGVAGGVWLALRAKWATLPFGVSLRMIMAMAPLAGIGFTVSLFIAQLSFDPGVLLDASKIGILLGSLVAALIGAAALLLASRRRSPRLASD